MTTGVNRRHRQRFRPLPDLSACSRDELCDNLASEAKQMADAANALYRVYAPDSEEGGNALSAIATLRKRMYFIAHAIDALEQHDAAL